MKRGVLLVTSETQGKKRVNKCIIEEAFDLDAPGDSYPLKCSPTDPEFVQLRQQPPAVQRAGEKLYGALVAHKDVRDFFAHTMPAVAAGAAQKQEFPLYIRLLTPDAEELPWEILYDKGRKFFSLDPDGRWPIGRLATPPRRAEPLDRLIGKELRMAVVLAAAGPKGVGASEWAGISSAIDKLPLPVDVLALASEDETEKAIQADVLKWQGGAHARKVEVIPPAESTLLPRLRAHLPNVIHFFCHGLTEGYPQLEIETRSDRRGGSERGSIRLGIGELRALARLDTLWLVVLNCCQGAKSAPQIHSLARDLVAAGVPAVVAMRESVDVSDANLFAEHFYPALFAQLKATFAVSENAAANDSFTIDEAMWVRAAHRARLKLVNAQRRAEDSIQWTYPVVYVHRDPLRLQARAPGAALDADLRLELTATLTMLSAIREQLAASADPQAVQKRIDLDNQIEQIKSQLAGG